MIELNDFQQILDDRITILKNMQDSSLNVMQDQLDAITRRLDLLEEWAASGVSGSQRFVPQNQESDQ